MDMSVPKVELVPFNEISDIMGDEDQTVVGIMLGFEGDVYGMMMFLLIQNQHIILLIHL